MIHVAGLSSHPLIHELDDMSKGRTEERRRERPVMPPIPPPEDKTVASEPSPSVWASRETEG